MRFRFRLIAVIVLGILAIPAVVSQPAPPRHYAGVGLRVGLRDSVAVALGLKLQILCVGEMAVTLRPTLLVGQNVELRTSFTLDVPVGNRFLAYGGAGVSYNESGSRRIDPMLSVGADLSLLDALVTSLTINHLFKPGDGDTEFIALLSYSFGRKPPCDDGQHPRSGTSPSDAASQMGRNSVRGTTLAPSRVLYSM
jgi:hypothetical protein